MGRIRIGGDLNGTLELQGQSTAVIDGDVNGKLVVGGINHIYIKGRLLRPDANFDMSGINTTYVGSYLARDDVLRFKNLSGIQTLHLRESDVERSDKAQSVGPWRNVHVQDPLWEQMR